MLNLAGQDFDNIDDIPRAKQNFPQNHHHKFLGNIGKTKSAGDLFKKGPIQRTFQQLNILKLTR